MKKLCLFGFIVLVNILLIGDVIAQDPPPRKGVTVSSPTGLKPKPDNLPRPPMMRPVPLNSSNDSSNIPDYIVYGTVFRIAAVNWLPEKVKFNPHEAEICKRYQIEKILTKKQESFLKDLAQETLAELDNLAEKSRPILEEFRAKMRSGMIVQGEGRPTPPLELEEINKQKIALIEAAVGKLKKNFGEKDFAKFTKFVDENIRSNFKTGVVPIPVKRS
jgi:hypothetical protein